MTYPSALHFRKTFNAGGLAGEQETADLLARAGFVVFFARSHEWQQPDLILYPNVEIEVKSSTLRLINRFKQGYQFNLYRTGRKRRIHEPVTALLCQQVPAVLALIPSDLILNHSAISIPAPRGDARLYSGKWSHFYNRFDVLTRAGAVRFAHGFVTNDREVFEHGHKQLSFAAA